MSKEEIFEKVKKIFKETFNSDAVTSETKKDDVSNWDSMTHVMFLSAIQKEFKVTFKMNDMMILNSIDKIVESVSNLL